MTGVDSCLDPVADLGGGGGGGGGLRGSQLEKREKILFTLPESGSYCTYQVLWYDLCIPLVFSCKDLENCCKVS